MARSGRTILVVSDNAVTILSTCAILFHGNYRIYVAATRARASKLAKAKGRTIDLAIIDVSTQDVNPSVLAAQLQSTRPGMQVLYLSSFVDGEVVRCGIVNQTVHGFVKEGIVGSVRKCLRYARRTNRSLVIPKTMAAGR